MGVESGKTGSDSVICPWCDYAHRELDEFNVPDGGESFVEVCRECDKEFEVSGTADAGYQATKRD